jgi:exopolyphosphatase/guanosine-5'-triphosphate,3'-diphosphate pyrophosphatase
MLGRRSEDDLRITTIQRFKKFYKIDDAQSNHVYRTTMQIFMSLMIHNKQDNEQIKLLQWAAELYEIGLSIAHNDYHKHGSYILEHSDMAGFSKPEQSLIADLVRSHRGNLIKALESLQGKRKIKLKLLYMVMAFRLSVILNRNRHGFALETLTIIMTSKSEFYLSIDNTWLKNNMLSLYSINEEIEQWNKCGITIALLAQ